MSKCAIADHKGRTFESQSAMCRTWGISIDVYYDRKRKGWPLEQILETPVGKSYAKQKPCTDHLGREFPSERAMAEAWGLDDTTYYSRKSYGWTTEKILTTPMLGPDTKPTAKPCTDHLGREFPSEKDMAEAWGLTSDIYYSRKKQGWSTEQILATPAAKTAKPCTDHTGREFPSEADMAGAWGLTCDTYRNRRKRGWTMKKSLETPIQKPEPCTDHKGQEFASLTAMLAKYHVNRKTFLQRIENGATLRQALGQETEYKDWSGRSYRSRSEMAKRLHIRESKLKYQMDICQEHENAASTACEKEWPGTDAGKYYIRECVSFPWFLCEDTTGDPDVPHSCEVVLHADRILALKNANDATKDGTAA